MAESCGLREKLVSLVNDWRNFSKNRKEIFEIVRSLEELKEDEDIREVRGIVLAAGKGSRALKSGMEVAKPVVSVSGKASVVHVLDKFFELGIEKVLVIVSPETEEAVRKVLKEAYGEREFEFVLQKEAFGTGHAVLQCFDALREFDGDVIVAWSTQPAVRLQSLKGCLEIHKFSKAVMTIPTVLRKDPYAPLIRDERGFVKAIWESNLEGKEVPAVGEDNIGAFVLKCGEMFDALKGAHERLWNGKGYDKPGELGFSNEVVRELFMRERIVLGVALADAREQQGIKEKKHVELLEKYLNELEKLGELDVGD